MVKLEVSDAHNITVNSRDVIGDVQLAVINKTLKTKSYVNVFYYDYSAPSLNIEFEYTTQEGSFYYLIIENVKDKVTTELCKHAAFCTDQTNTPYKSVETIDGLTTF